MSHGSTKQIGQSPFIEALKELVEPPVTVESNERFKPFSSEEDYLAWNDRARYEASMFMECYGGNLKEY